MASIIIIGFVLLGASDLRGFHGGGKTYPPISSAPGLVVTVAETACFLNYSLSSVSIHTSATGTVPSMAMLMLLSPPTPHGDIAHRLRERGANR